LLKAIQEELQRAGGRREGYRGSTASRDFFTTTGEATEGSRIR